MSATRKCGPLPRTCGGYLGSWLNEKRDADSYASWGVDYLKYDWCSYDGMVKDDTGLAAPLLIGCDISRLDAFTLNLLTNDEVLAVDQDPLGRQAVQVIRKDRYQVWVKELEDGTKAIGSQKGYLSLPWISGTPG